MKYQKTYKTLGFVEALISILVAGMASIVLLGIASSTVEQVLKNEISDKLTETAVEGANMVKIISANNNSSSGVLFPPISGNVGKCFILNNDLNTPAFKTNGNSFSYACSYDSQGKDNCTNYLSDDPSVFRVYCITSESDIASGTTVGKVVTGLAACDSSSDSGKCSVQDYQYVVVVKTEQK